MSMIKVLKKEFNTDLKNVKTEFLTALCGLCQRNGSARVTEEATKHAVFAFSLKETAEGGF